MSPEVMQPYEPMAVDAGVALSLLSAHPPYRDLMDFHGHLLGAIAAKLESQAGEELASRLQEWFEGAKDRDEEGAPEKAPQLRSSPRLPSAAKSEVPWPMLAAIAAELPQLTASQIGAAMQIVIRVQRTRPSASLQQLAQLLDQATELHNLAAQGTLDPADVRLCLTVDCLTPDPAAMQRRALDAWRTEGARGSSELTALAQRLSTKGPRWTALRWRLAAIAPLLDRAAPNEAVPPDTDTQEQP